MSGISPEALVRAGRRWGLPVPVHFVEETPSTMDEARRLAEAGAPHGASIVARRQTGGRGRLARRWIHADGAVALSVVLRPGLSVSDIGLISLAAGLAAWEVCGPRYAIKWPNDVLAPGGRKVAGVLAELDTRGRSLAHVIVGIGVNVTATPPEVPRAAALAEFDEAPRDPADVAAHLVRALLDAVALAEARPAALIAAWQDASATVGRRVRVSGVEGQALGVTTEGALLVGTDDGAAIVVHAGDVVHLG